MPQDTDVARRGKQISKDDLIKLKRSEKDESELRHIVEESEKFSPQEKSALKVDSVQSFEEYWNVTLGIKDLHDSKHNHGQTATSYAVSASEILQDMSPIVDLIKDFAYPYGGMAIGTITFFLAVARSRADIEVRINATLLTIQNRLRGIRMYRKIYDDNHELDLQLQSKIINAYDSFISFCIGALKFYTMNRARRWLKASARSTVLADEASQVEQAVVDVRLVSEELLGKNVDIVKRKLERMESINNEQLKRIDELNAQIQELRAQQDHAVLEEIRNSLNVERQSKETEAGQLESHRGDVAAEFGRNHSFNSRLKAAKGDDAFLHWKMSSESSLLVMVGYNQILQARHCWLSLIALDLITELSTSETHGPCVSYLIGARDSDDDCCRVLSVIAFRLLNLHAETTQSKREYGELLSEIQEYNKAERKGIVNHPTYGFLEKMLLRILNMFDPNRIVWMILDRLDECYGTESRNYQRNQVLRILVRLVDNRELRVKVHILVIVNGADWQVEGQGDEFGVTRKESLTIRVFRQIGT